MGTRSPGLKSRRPPRRVRSRVLIVTEGVKTEIQYLEGLIQHLRTSGFSVRSAQTRGVGRDPLSVLAAARAMRLADRDGYDQVWVVVDVDDHDSLSHCIIEGSKAGIPVIISNPCFEVWLLWHFQDHASHQDSRGLSSLLTKCGHVGKSISATFPFDQYPAAVCRALKTVREHSIIGPNPSSSMPSLVAALAAPPS